MSTIPREAREGLLRAWIALLEAKTPGVIWVPAPSEQGRRETPTPRPGEVPSTPIRR